MSNRTPLPLEGYVGTATYLFDGQTFPAHNLILRCARSRLNSNIHIRMRRAWGANQKKREANFFTVHPQPSTLNPQPSTFNPPPSTLNPPPSTLNS